MRLTTFLAGRDARPGSLEARIMATLEPPTPTSPPERPVTRPCPLHGAGCPLRLDPITLVYVDADGIALDPDAMRAILQ